MIKSFYISRGWFYAFATVVLFIVMGFYIPVFLYLGQLTFFVLLTFTLLDAVLLFRKKAPIAVTRTLPERLNLSDETTVSIRLINQTNSLYKTTVYDEPPYEMQARDLVFYSHLKGHTEKTVEYPFRPTRRGQYKWRNIHVFIRSFIGLVERRIIFPSLQEVSVYPSVLQMKKFEFLMFNPQTQQRGIKKIRRLGHNNEFEQIKNYVQGDDIRTINWKATSRTNELMINQYQEQRSQSVYAVIDKSRAMEHSFNGLTLLDYSINSALVFSNIALRKGDKMGVLSFSHKMGSMVAASTGRKQLQFILETLFAQKTAFKEANYPVLYLNLRKHIRSRSLLMLYTNFETELSMRRALPLLKRINKHHVLVVVFFKNTDLAEQVMKEPDTVRDVYVSTLADDVMNIKKRIADELKQHGIQTILTVPDELNVDTINKYLEIKSKGVI